MRTWWRPSVRLRLTVTYSALILATGVAVLGTSYIVFRHHETAPGTTEAVICSGAAEGGGSAPGGGAAPAGGSAVSGTGSAGSGTGSATSGAGSIRSGTGSATAQPGVTHQSCQAFGTISSSGLFVAPPSFGLDQHQYVTRLAATVRASQSEAVNSLLVVIEVALAVMAVLSLGLGWWISGRVLRPVHRITETARRLSEKTLHDRIDLDGPDDELKELADTFDDMLGRLDQAFTSQRRFVANASHELRTPLATERVLIDEALAAGAGPEETRAILEQLLINNQETEQLIDALLTLARSEQGLRDRHPVDLAEAAAAALDRAAAEAGARSLEVRSDLAPAGTLGDPGLVERLAANLVDNDFRHNHPGGRVSVTTCITSEGPTLTVANSGPRIDTAEVTGLMEPFRRGAADRRPSGPGHGLGLSIVNAIAKAHRARLVVTAPEEGGLVVSVVFPPA